MSKTLGGFLFIRNGITYDYNFRETIESMFEFCDQVAVVDAGSDDGTKEVLWGINDSKLTVRFLLKEEWDNQHGREKLSYFQNMASEMLTTDYQFLCQADEIVHEESYATIREAIKTDQDGFMCTRINLWGDPWHELNVPLSRMPCSPQVIRLSKRGYKTYDDGESISANPSFRFVNDIRIYHMGFVRKREIMKSKIINMQTGVFEMSDYDEKLKGMDIFNPYAWFTKNELKAISEPLPKIIQKWALERSYQIH